MKTVAVVVSSGIEPFLLSVPRLVFDDLAPDKCRRRAVLCAETPGRLAMGGGLEADVAHGLEALETCSLAVVPYWPHPEEKPSDALLEALRRAHRRGVPVAGLCLGAFVLGYAGLLDGRRATTHWQWCDDFARSFPAARLEPNALYTDDAGVITSAGISAGIDCCLHILRTLEGAAAANAVSRRLVAPPFREGGQAQYIEEPLSVTTKDARLKRVTDMLATHPEQPADFAQLASEAAMSLRTFYRAFSAATGLPPHAWLLAARLKKAQALLETTDFSVEQIAGDAGFDSAVTFRQRFRERFGVTPSAWRRTFRGRI